MKALLLFLACQALVLAQTKPNDKKAAQERWNAFYAQVVRLQGEAKAAYDREMAREKAGDCRDADNTRSIVSCLETENLTTEANYRVYTGALRSRLGLTPGDEDLQPGPTGKPLTAKETVDEFDAAESAWQKYKKAQCTAAYDLFKGGTAAGPEAGVCWLRLTRSHMRELEAVYHMPLHN
jgi:hypothetical protein